MTKTKRIKKHKKIDNRRFVTKCGKYIGVLCLASLIGCSHLNNKEANTSNYHILIGNVTLGIGDDVEVLNEIKEAPISTYEVTSCAADGKETIYTYKNYEITTRDVGTGEYIYSIVLLNDLVSTKEGIHLGDREKKVTDAYGDGEKTDNAISYHGSAMLLRFIIENDVIVSIQYIQDQEADLGNKNARNNTKSYPRDISKAVYKVVEKEIGTPVSMQDFWNLDTFEKELNMSRDDLGNIYFETDPNIEYIQKLGSHEIWIIAGDQKINTVLKMVDTKPPVITVPDTVRYSRGERILYRKDVIVEDNSGEDIELIIDNINVKENVPGQYKVGYYATDSSGNEGYTESIVEIVEEHKVDETVVNELAEKLIGSITTDDMSQYDKAAAVFDWCIENIKYMPTASKDSIIIGAYDGLYYMEGDCFTYYATSKYLLDYCGIDNISVSHRKGELLHQWLIINVGSGWYHFDTGTHRDGFKCFMQTDLQVKQYAENVLGKTGYFDIDEKEIPARANKTILVSKGVDW